VVGRFHPLGAIYGFIQYYTSQKRYTATVMEYSSPNLTLIRDLIGPKLALGCLELVQISRGTDEFW
jgi:hypothetical protein